MGTILLFWISPFLILENNDESIGFCHTCFESKQEFRYASPRVMYV